MTLVWGRPLVDGSAVATAELATSRSTSACWSRAASRSRPDAYRGDTLDVKLFDRRGKEVARESLYTDDDEDDEDEG